MPTDYSLSKIYKLVAKDTTDIWIGSTTQPLNRRLMDHKIKYDKLVKTDVDDNLLNKPEILTTEVGMFLNYPEVYIELIEVFGCLNKVQLDNRVDEIIKINSEVAINSKPIQEATLGPKAVSKRSARNKKYYNDNKEAVKANRDAREGAKSVEAKAEARRIYRENNKDTINSKERLRRKHKALAETKA